MGLEGLSLYSDKNSPYFVTTACTVQTKTIVNINIVSVHGHENCQSCHHVNKSIS